MPNAVPSDSITLYFPIKGGGYGRVRLAWQQDRQVVDYLRDPAVREFHLLALRNRCKVRDELARPLRFGSVVRSGATIVMQRAARV